MVTPEVSNEKASFTVSGTIKGFNQNLGYQLKYSLLDNEGVQLITKEIELTTADYNFQDALNAPKLWHTNSPSLYTLVLRLQKDGELVDEISEKIGFRWFEFKPYGGFYLNGERLLLRGTHRHEEHAGVGAAVSNKQHWADIQQIKDMGANFVRLGHYPQDPEVYKACDSLGLLVWDEIPWCRGGVGEDLWKTNTKNFLTEMITQNHNHPSIITWSLGNEIYWLPDFEDGDNREKINTFLKELQELSKSLDPNRPTAIRKYYEGSDIVDVFSPSIWSGWYSGSYKNYGTALETYKKKYPRFIHVEYGASSHFGKYAEDAYAFQNKVDDEGWEEQITQTGQANVAQIGDWSESYAIDLFDWHLHVTEEDSTFVGNAQWAFKDFGTPLRPENPIPYVNQKGLVDRDGNPKESFYVFKSYWAEQPFVHIVGNNWKVRQGEKDQEKEVRVYSNCESVQLFHNGINLGKITKDNKVFPAGGLVWDVKFKEGENTLKAIGTNGIEDEITFLYRTQKNGNAKQLQLTYQATADNNYLITALALDANGLPCVDYNKRVYFQCLSGGQLLENQGTIEGSSIIEMANGRAQIKLIANAKSKPVKVVVYNQEFKGEYLVIK